MDHLLFHCVKTRHCLSCFSLLLGNSFELERIFEVGACYLYNSICFFAQF